ncbi:histidine acid phosphatase [Histomonas meleagridis]|uniref:histidine acid phosphatase n=1 Tax=Histomonas meleagridis TaxID=135588 RepID=UPI003559EA5F|nr:histidine acid phosphatase [Histomonas meleagridis]KAH0798769.1 histidine acid phosphatase [Histomonas meleagridis]
MGITMKIVDPLCEPPYPPYEEIESTNLIQVHVITRHGARTSLHIPKNVSNVWKCYNKNLRSYSYLHDFPIKINIGYGKSVSLGNCIIGQLIETGAEGLRKLGSYFRSIYVNQLKFIPSTYKRPVILFRTTWTHRTLNSQMNFIDGLYPNHKKVYIETADHDFDQWRNPENLCPNLGEKMSKAKSKVNFSDEDKAMMSQASKILGSTWRFNLDATVPVFCEDMKLPRPINRDYIIDIQRVKAQEAQQANADETVYPLSFGFSMSEILNHILNRINGNSTVRFIHWSAHDGNLNAALGYLGYINGMWPPFGSYLVIEVLKKDNSFFVVFRFNGKIILSPRFGHQKLVPFEEFEKFVRGHVPDLHRDCKFDIEVFKKKIAFDNT